MAFGSYRLSLDEQVQLAVETSHAARRQRILTVRRQARSFAKNQRERYKSLLEAEEDQQQRQRLDAWELERDRQLAALLRRYGREIESIGSAQKKAEEAAETERVAKKESQIKEDLSNSRRQTRFRQALRVLRDMDAAKRRRLQHLIEQRVVETKRSREMAHHYDLNRVVKEDAGNALEDVLARRARARWVAAAIDFRFSRVHQQLGVSEKPTLHAAENCENAMTAAEKEREKLVELDRSLQKKRTVAEEQVRDRGEVALLRERAIVQKQMHETYLEQLRRSEIKRQQKATIATRPPLRHRVQNQANRSEADETVKQILTDLEKMRITKEPETLKQSCQGASQHEEPFKMEAAKVDASVQVNTEVDAESSAHEAAAFRSRSVATTTVPACCHQAASSVGAQKGNRPRRAPVAGSTQKTQAALAARQAPQKNNDSRICTMKQMTGKPEQPIQADKAHLKERQTKRAIRKPQPRCTRPCNSKNELIETCQLLVKAETRNPETAQERKKAVHPAAEREANQRCKERTEDYEDALSEALSMDTDLFMHKFFHAVERDSSETSDDVKLDDLSALLASETDAASSFSLSPICQSDLETATVKASESPPHSFTLAETDSPFISETLPSEGPLASEVDPQPKREIEALFKGLGQISGDSLSLLSSLSTILTTQNTSESSSTRTVSSSEPLEAEPPRVLSVSPSSSPDASLLLDTIPEETDDPSSISISDLEEAFIYRDPCSLEISSEASSFNAEL